MMYPALIVKMLHALHLFGNYSGRLLDVSALISGEGGQISTGMQNLKFFSF